MTRRHFVRGIASTVAAVGLGQSDLLVKSAPSMTKTGGRRPNVLFVVADQHNANVMGNAGHLVVKTPSDRRNRLIESELKKSR